MVITEKKQQNVQIERKIYTHWCQSQTTSQLDIRWFFNAALNLSELEICLTLIGKLSHKNGNW